MVHLIASDGGTTKNNKSNKAKKSSGAFGSNVPTVGLRVVCQSALASVDYDDENIDKNDDADVEELDELIWWSWDGKLVGFSD